VDPTLAPQAGPEGAGAGFQVGSASRVIFGAIRGNAECSHRDPRRVGVLPPPECFFFVLVYSSVVSHWEQRPSSACVWKATQEKALLLKSNSDESFL